MGASKRIKEIMREKRIKQIDIAKEVGKDKQYIYNALYKDNLSFERAEQILDILGCDIVFKDRETGEEY